MFVELINNKGPRSAFRIGTYGGDENKKVHRIMFDLVLLLKINVNPGDRLRLMHNDDKTILKFIKSQDYSGYKVSLVRPEKLGVISVRKFLNFDNGTKHFIPVIDESDHSITINL